MSHRLTMVFGAALVFGLTSLAHAQAAAPSKSSDLTKDKKQLARVEAEMDKDQTKLSHDKQSLVAARTRLATDEKATTPNQTEIAKDRKEVARLEARVDRDQRDVTKDSHRVTAIRADIKKG